MLTNQDIQILVFRCIVLCGYQHFRETYYLQLRGRRERSYDFMGYENCSWINQKVHGGCVMPVSWELVEEL
jgi:hypothetical protein